MQQQQDKEFDAGLRRKMQNFSAAPPAALWENINEEINGPKPKKRSMGYTWLKIAASICLLAAAGFWLYQSQPQFNNEIAVGPGKEDSVTKSSGGGVTIYNKSRSRDTARQEAAGNESRATVSTANGDGFEPHGESLATAAAEANPLKETPLTVDPGSESLAALATGSAPLKESTEEGVAIGNSALAESAEEALAVAIDPLATAEPTLETLALVEPPVLKSRPAANGPGSDNPASDDPAADDRAPDDRAPDEGAKTLAAAGKQIKVGELVPEAIRELDGVGEALNMAASTIDRSEKKFLHIGRDKESGSWEGVSLDLGLLTISYNKPTKKTQHE